MDRVFYVKSNYFLQFVVNAVPLAKLASYILRVVLFVDRQVLLLPVADLYGNYKQLAASLRDCIHRCKAPKREHLLI